MNLKKWLSVGMLCVLAAWFSACGGGGAIPWSNQVKKSAVITVILYSSMQEDQLIAI